MFVAAIIFILLNLILFSGHNWLADNVGLVSMDEVVYHLKVPLVGTSGTIIWSVALWVVIVPLILTAIIGVVIRLFKGKDLKVKIRDQERVIRVGKLLPRAVLALGVIFCGMQLVWFNDDYDIVGYIISQNQWSKLIEENYVDPQEVEISFPEKKRNLIYIFLESTESTYFSEKNGGTQEKSLMPEVEKIALENTNFSNNGKLGGAEQATATSWTVAGIVSQTAGVPLKLHPEIANDYGTNADTLLSGVYTIGDILGEQGYKQVFMAGSDMTFGGRRVYFKDHGNYEVKDVYTAEEDGLIPEGRRVFWGFEDTYLYKYAKQELTELAKSGQPFNFSMLTENTHFPDGYIDEGCKETYEEQYTNSVVCSSKYLADFLEWVKQQDFYQNTTIVISGDHLSMANSSIFEKAEAENIPRTTLNIVINSALKDPEEGVSKNRTFTTMDMFPTTLAALGVKVEGERLALGTNLYSGEQTLAEKYGMETLNEELSKRSEFYDKKFF